MQKCCRIFMLALFSIVTMSAYAQTDWVWEQHNITFTLAEDFKAVTNTADEFTASGDGMEFAIYPFSDNTIDHSNITAYTLKIAKSIEMDQLDDVDVVDLNGLEGAYVEGYKDGARVILLGFIDPSSDTNFFSVIAFADDDEEAEAETIRIIKSFRKK